MGARVGRWYVLTAARWHGDLRVSDTYDMTYAVPKTPLGREATVRQVAAGAKE